MAGLMPKKPHILIIDDDVQVAEFLKVTLEMHGYQAVSVNSGRKGLEMIRARRPDLLILDLNMPEPDGFDLLKIERAELPYLRILVISGYLEGFMLKAAKLVGATATLQKPISPEALLEKVHDILGQ